jgi:tRNA(Ile)-lysidine synthase
MVNNHFERAVIESMRTRHLLRAGARVVAGISGGPDSVALLGVLCACARVWGVRVYAAHLDHGLRASSAKDAAFVKALCVRWNVPCSVARVAVARPKTGGSLEQAAREARFAFLCEVARAHKARVVALGHHRDDLAETVLMRIIRGTGLYGLAAIEPKRRMFGVTVIRPLLDVSREDIERYCARKKVRPRRDPTNDDERFLRNRIRRNLLPFLDKEFGSAVRTHLCTLAETAARDYAYLRTSLMRTYRRFGPAMDIGALARLDPAARAMVLRFRYAALSGDTRRLTMQHIRELEDCVMNRPAHSVVHLPRGVRVHKGTRTLRWTQTH